MSPNSKEFKKLQSTWYKKLAKDGFEDIEQDEDNLHTWTSTLQRQWRVPLNNSSRTEYYRMAGHFLYDYPFESNLEKAIWALHAEGNSIREMVPKLKAMGFKTYKDNTHIILKKLVKAMVQRVKQK